MLILSSVLANYVRKGIQAIAGWVQWMPLLPDRCVLHLCRGHKKRVLLLTQTYWAATAFTTC